MKKIQLYEVKSFGKFPLSGCFDEAYVSALLAVGINPAYYLMNECGGLGKTEQGNYFSLDKRLSLEAFEEELGIDALDYRIEKENVVDETIKNLRDGYLVITRVRGISGTNIETGKKTQRSYSEHWILVYGYDPEKEKFIVLEHNNNISAKYAPCLIDVSEYRNAYGLAQEKETDSSNDIHAIKRKDNESSASIESELFKSFLRDYSADMAGDKHKLEQFIADANTSPAYISVLNEVIKKYQKEQWIEDEINMHLESAENLIRELFLVRTYCVKAQFLGLTKPDDKLRDHMRKAMVCSDKYYEDKKSVGIVA